MKVDLRVLSEVSGIQTLLYEGESEFLDGRFSYRENGSGALTRISIYEDGLEILRETEGFRSELSLRSSNVSAKIDSPEGSFTLEDMEFLSYDYSPHRILLTYRVAETRNILIEL